ncbi:paraquat-inducible protein A [Salipiger aestuarii]|uniref:Paraquat-inducible protein A n=1 Tax=Salipiger aestuarii TaxID=568098 RepID=A0A327Y6V3_9RHOB|nr:paraquat-inducible protein A [Salipiger aestuarii]EIE51879.1 paraquat-inducible protein A [Citreicella sp. 357]KAA8608316.1 paraquat-inducible protein A [Salipiger aestuarii]KAA8612873.1 paraquat-inducible protein A [Salipiger aestuarii]KAB2542217.1 paraquat-inducible protein A [Salipiger aestuarii]RAK16810.1 paraquat-inducible protein A [Salipiger aestuarii]
MENAGRAPQVLTAHAAGLVGCVQCGRVHRPDVMYCDRCGAVVTPPDPSSLQRVWAWLLAGLIVYIPANVFPMLRTSILGQTTDSTIYGGVVDLVHHGSYGIAAIVFVASIIIPCAKFVAIIFLALTVQRRVRISTHARHKLYEVVEFIGRWSMIDVFVVAILSSLVQLDFAASINPGIAAVSFALSVAFTMISAESFDSRLIWNADGEDYNNG